MPDPVPVPLEVRPPAPKPVEALKPVSVAEAVNAARAKQQETTSDAKLREKAGTPANQRAFEQTQGLLHDAFNDMEEHIPGIKDQRAKLVVYQAELKTAQNAQQRQEIQDRMNADCADAIMVDTVAAASQMNKPGQETVDHGKKQKVSLALVRRYYTDQAANVYTNNPDATHKQNQERYANLRDRAEAADRLAWTVGEVVDINHPGAVRRLARWVGNGVGRGMRVFARGADRWVVQEYTGKDWTPFQKILGTRGRTPAMLPMADSQLQAMDQLTARMESGDQNAFAEARRMANDMLQADREAILKQANPAVEKPAASAAADATAKDKQTAVESAKAEVAQVSNTTTEIGLLVAGLKRALTPEEKTAADALLANEHDKSKRMAMVANMMTLLMGAGTVAGATKSDVVSSSASGSTATYEGANI